MHSDCDHCGKDTDRSASDADIVWCGQCMVDHWDAIQALDLNGGPYGRQSGSWIWGNPDNITKLRTIPKDQPPPPEVPAVVVEPVAPEVVETVPKFDFDKYNHTIPGTPYIVK